MKRINNVIIWARQFLQSISVISICMPFHRGSDETLPTTLPTTRPAGGVATSGDIRKVAKLIVMLSFAGGLAVMGSSSFVSEKSASFAAFGIGMLAAFLFSMFVYFLSFFVSSKPLNVILLSVSITALASAFILMIMETVLGHKNATGRA